MPAYSCSLHRPRAWALASWKAQSAFARVSCTCPTAIRGSLYAPLYSGKPGNSLQAWLTINPGNKPLPPGHLPIHLHPSASANACFPVNLHTGQLIGTLNPSNSSSRSSLLNAVSTTSPHCQKKHAGYCGLLLSREMGGYMEAPLMEDVDLVRRLYRTAGPPVIVPQPIVTSARRWQRLGFLRTTLTNWTILCAWRCGVDPARLAAWYYSSRSW